MPYHIGFDIGGTFTDCAVLNGTGTVVTTAKSPTDPHDPSEGALNSLSAAAENLGLTLEALLADTATLIHGCTVGTNAMIERKGARVGLITTRGHEDCLFIGKVNQKVAGLSEREILHQRALEKADPPIVDPALVHGVSERVDALGEVVVELNQQELDTALTELRHRGIESLAVCYLWSFVNPQHERATAAFVTERDPGLPVSLSAEVAPILGEYERMATTVLSAYLRPRMAEYLTRLEGKLRQRGFGSQLLMSHGMGGLTSVQEARERPLLTLDSGPAGGVVGLQYFSEAYGEPNIIGTDMGGTSFDVSIVEHGRATLDDEPVIEKYRFLLPKLAVRSVGAGGGSLIWADEEGILQVGPRSAGADPGPACYDAGGTAPAVTDADVLLGYLNPDNFLGGRKRLDRARAQAALAAVGRPIGMSAEEVAAGAFEIVNSHMADLVRKCSIERGYDPRDFALFAFGGASPTHVCFFAQDLQVRSVYVPRHASVFCALGMLTGGILHSHEASLPLNFPFTREDVVRVNAMYRELTGKLAEQFTQEGLSLESAQLTRYAYVKYRLQPRTLLTALPSGELTWENQDALRVAFEQRYLGIYGPGSGYPQAGFEVIKYRVDGFVPSIVPSIAPDRVRSSADPSSALRGARNVYFAAKRGFIDTPVFDGERLVFGNVVEGPCIVERMGDTVVVPPGVQAAVDQYQNLRIEGFARN